MRRNRVNGHNTLERVDGEGIREMTQGRGWKLMALRLGKMRGEKIRALVTPQSELETATLRGAITMLDTMLRLPDILESEAEPRKGAPSA